MREREERSSQHMFSQKAPFCLLMIGHNVTLHESGLVCNQSPPRSHDTQYGTMEPIDISGQGKQHYLQQ